MLEYISVIFFVMSVPAPFVKMIFDIYNMRKYEGKVFYVDLDWAGYVGPMKILLVVTKGFKTEFQIKLANGGIGWVQKEDVKFVG